MQENEENSDLDDFTSPEEIYEVGYCKPPKDTQFKKGQSGNPKGRRKKSTEPYVLYCKAMQKKMKVNGILMTKEEAFFESLANDGIRGSCHARRLGLELMNENAEEMNRPFDPLEEHFGRY